MHGSARARSGEAGTIAAASVYYVYQYRCVFPLIQILSVKSWLDRLSFKLMFLFYTYTNTFHVRIDTSKIAQKLLKQSGPNVYLVILEYKETQEADLIGKLTIMVIVWVRNT